MTDYIGVSGFMSRNEVEMVLKRFPQDHSRMLMVGVLASSKTLSGKPNRWPNRYPSMNKIAKIFPDDPRVLSLIHYATDDPQTIDAQLKKLIVHGGENLDGFQLNMIWPDPKLLKRALLHHHWYVVLQIGNKAFTQVECDPNKLAEKLTVYTEFVTDILFDLSGGLGKTLDPSSGLDVLRAVRAHHPNLGIGIAGGLCIDTLHLIEPIVQEFPDVSIDAEGRLRESKDSALDIQKTQNYVALALKMFSS